MTERTGSTAADSVHGQAHLDSTVVIVTSRSFICVHINSLSSDTQCLSLGSKWILCFFDNPALEWMPTNCFLVHSSSLETTSGQEEHLMFLFQQSLHSALSPILALAHEPDLPCHWAGLEATNLPTEHVHAEHWVNLQTNAEKHSLKLLPCCGPSSGHRTSPLPGLLEE